MPATRETRADRARKLYDAGAVKPVKVEAGEFEVHSQSERKWYFVCTVEGAEYCDCPDFQKHGHICKHVQAALMWQREGKPKIRLTGTAKPVDLVDVIEKVRAAQAETGVRQAAYHVAVAKAATQRALENDLASLYG